MKYMLMEYTPARKAHEKGTSTGYTFLRRIYCEIGAIRGHLNTSPPCHTTPRRAEWFVLSARRYGALLDARPCDTAYEILPMRCAPARCTPMRYMPAAPIRCRPVRCTPCEIHISIRYMLKMRLYGIHICHRGRASHRRVSWSLSDLGFRLHPTLPTPTVASALPQVHSEAGALVG
jgi:hypothetical protein